MKAFYFSNDEMKLLYGDNRPIAVNTTHWVEGEIVACENGLHASERLIDALKYAPGNQLFLVELSGDMDIRKNKVAAQCRTYLAHFNAEELLKSFARKQARINIEKIKPYCSSEDYELILHYLVTGDESAESAAWSAAWSAARSAARSAAWTAAWTAAESATRSAAYENANNMLTDMVRKATGWDI